MSVHIDLDSLTPETDISNTVNSIISEVLETIPAYLRSYYTEVTTDNKDIYIKGFYPYLKNIVTYLLQGLNALFDLKINMGDSSVFTKINNTGITNKQLLCAKKTCELLGIVNADYTGFTDDTEENTNILRMQYLQALYISEVNRRLFNGSHTSYNSLISSALPNSSVTIVDYGIYTDETYKSTMNVGVNVDTVSTNIFTQMNSEIVRNLLTPKLLGVNTNTNVSDINTLYWDYRTEPNDEGIIEDNPKKAEWDVRRWVGEY